MIEIRALSKRFGDNLVLDGIDLSIPSPGVTAIIGASGRGKTTLLRLLAGLERPDGGSIDGVGRVAYMFQEPRLLPWLTAAQNVNLVLRDNAESMLETMTWLARLEIANAAEQYPHELSGGMQQRVALARTLAYGGDTILLDEPFRALDRPLRLRLYPLLREAAKTAAVVMVTHDPEDAEQLGAAVIEL